MSYIATAHDAVIVGLGALATIALFVSVPATAEQPPEVRVNYSDLDLTSETDQGTLDKRIHSAVKRVCRDDGNAAEGAVFESRCRRESLARANGQMQVAIAKAGQGKTGIASLALGGSKAKR